MNKVAVITRTKNRPVFLRRAVESVARQTYTDYIHVIVNDGGDRDAIEHAIDELTQEARERVVVFHRDESSNAPDTIFNESIDRVDSEFFAIHDDDDTWDKDFLLKTVQHLEQLPELAATVVRTDKIIEKIDNQSIAKVKQTPWMTDIRVINLYRQCIDNQFTPIATLFRRSAYEAVGKFDASLPVVGDWEFGIRLLQKFEADVLLEEKVLAYYHHRPYKKGAEGNTSFAGNEKHRYWTNYVMNKYLRDELAEGRLGVGYIMSQLKYNEHKIAQLVGKFIPNSILRKVKNKVGN